MPRPSACGSCGTCDRCKRAAYMREWYRRPGNADAQRESARRSRLRRLPAVREYDRERGFRVYDIEKVNARKAVLRALKSGQIKRGWCEECGAPAEAHHDDYSKPLDIRWLCRPHHAELHRKVA